MPPTILLTLGDVAGVGPEVIAAAWPQLLDLARPIVVGDPVWLQRALELVQSPARVQPVQHLADATPTLEVVPCWHVPTADLSAVVPGQVSAAAGRAAYDWLCAAIDACMSGHADGIMTGPLHKEGLHAAGVPHPGHTEILAARTGAARHAMLLVAEEPFLAVAHVTLHMALRDVFAHLTTESVRAKIDLLDELLPKLLGWRPRIGVAALNPHAGDGELFGDEEARIVAPAVEAARVAGVHVSGPWPVDTLFVRASAGEFDGIVALYHDQGHIAMKLRYGRSLVNVTAGLPIVRTSVAHGTAYDVAWQGCADASSVTAAVRVAARLAQREFSAQTLSGE